MRRVLHLAAKLRKSGLSYSANSLQSKHRVSREIGKSRRDLSHTNLNCARGLEAAPKVAQRPLRGERYSGCFLIWHVTKLALQASRVVTLTCWPAGPRMRSGIVVALPLTAVSSQFVIGSFEARFFLRRRDSWGRHSCLPLEGESNLADKNVCPTALRPSFAERPKQQPGCDRKRRFCVRCAGRVLSPSRS